MDLHELPHEPLPCTFIKTRFILEKATMIDKLMRKIYENIHYIFHLHKCVED